MSTTEHKHAPGDTGAPRDPYRCSSMGDCVTVPTLLSHATIHTTTFPHRRGEGAMKRAVAPVQAVLRRFYHGAALAAPLRHLALDEQHNL